MDDISLPHQSDSDVPAPEPVREPRPSPSTPRLRVLISACLLGDLVRYDGQHKRDPYIAETLGRFLEFVRVCPEVDCGLPVPRPSMHLVGDPASPRLISSRGGTDHTERMERFARERVRQLEGMELCGYICKKGSPSSGMERVRVYDERGGVRRVGAGIFTRIVMEHFPLLPVEEEGRLHDPGLRECFVERIFSMHRWHELVRAGRSRGRLVEFHANHKLLLLSHSRTAYTALGRLVAHAKERRLVELYDEYHRLFMEALARPATVPRTTDVLMHMVGHFRAYLDADEKRELLEVIADYHQGLVPLAVPLTLVRHYVRKYDVPYLRRQVFLSPFPTELMLRNHV